MKLEFSCLQASVAKWMRTALFWGIAKCMGFSFKGQLTPEGGTDTLHRNVGEELPLYTA